MTNPLAIPIGPERSVWVFAIDLPKEQAETFATGPLSDALGVASLDPAQTEYLDADTFTEYGFSRYLVEGQGVTEDSVAKDIARLDVLRGPVLLVFRPGLGQGRLAPRPPLRLIGRYDEVPPPPLVSLPDYDPIKDTVPITPKKRPSEAAMSGRVAMAVLVLLFLFAALFVWSAS
ncbi:MAG: hypothetical protein JXR75_04985 [Rhodobacteraceae bacterium]|nr:hypothetical protein [Paracoccaceae bacterium]